MPADDQLSERAEGTEQMIEQFHKRSDIQRTLKKAAERLKDQCPEVLFGTMTLYESAGLYRIKGSSSAKAFDDPDTVEEYKGSFTSLRAALEYVDDIHCGRPDKYVVLILTDMTVRPAQYINYSKGERQAESILIERANED